MVAGDFDVVILGGGMGGTCLHIGCIPTKVLLESSELYHRVSARGAEFGIDAGKVSFDYPRIATRRDAVVNQLYKGVQFLMKKNKIEVIAGAGKLRDRNTIAVGATQVKAPQIIIATGSVVKPLPGIEFDGEYIISCDHATLATTVPESICIIGAGAVGVEFATLYNQLGVKVTLLEAL